MENHHGGVNKSELMSGLTEIFSEGKSFSCWNIKLDKELKRSEPDMKIRAKTFFSSYLHMKFIRMCYNKQQKEIKKGRRNQEAMKILFLEDEPTIREVLTEYMKIQGYEVTCAKDGEEALKLLGREAFDMAVLDIMVPKVSGLKVLSFIKEKRPETATIMLTALDDEKTQVQAFNAYADDYVIKPVSPIILLKRMETILRRVKKTGWTEEKGLIIHGDSYQAYYDGKPLELTLSEFLLLQVLEKEPGRAFTREQLILRIYNEDYVGNDRIIDAHVKNLRKKLPKNYIKTVIGIGYQFKEGE